MQIDAGEIYNQKRDNFGLATDLQTVCRLSNSPHMYLNFPVCLKNLVYIMKRILSVASVNIMICITFIFDYNNELSGGIVYLQTCKYH